MDTFWPDRRVRAATRGRLRQLDCSHKGGVVDQQRPAFPHRDDEGAVEELVAAVGGGQEPAEEVVDQGVLRAGDGQQVTERGLDHGGFRVKSDRVAEIVPGDGQARSRTACPSSNPTNKQEDYRSTRSAWAFSVRLADGSAVAGLPNDDTELMVRGSSWGAPGSGPLGRACQQLLNLGSIRGVKPTQCVERFTPTRLGVGRSTAAAVKETYLCQQAGPHLDLAKLMSKLMCLGKSRERLVEKVTITIDLAQPKQGVR